MNLRDLLVKVDGEASVEGLREFPCVAAWRLRKRVASDKSRLMVLKRALALRRARKMISQNYLDLSVKVILRGALCWEAPCVV